MIIKCFNRGRRQTVPASITVEAALAFPIFFYAVIALVSLFSFMEVKLAVKRAMVETARDLSAYGDLIVKADSDASSVLGYLTDAVAVRALLENELDSVNMIESTVEGGRAGIVCAGSELMTGDECISIICSYCFKPPVSFFGLGHTPVVQKFDYRYFTGYKVESVFEEAQEEKEDDDDDTTVYVTDQGKVYHIQLTCPALNLHIREVSSDNVASQRNEGGGKYYPCEKCAKGQKPDTLYITTDGDRYHYKLNCSGLKRTIKEVKLSELENVRACKRCGKKE